MIVRNGQFPSIEQVSGQYLEANRGSRQTVNGSGKSFAEVLAGKQSGQGRVEELKFSKHASNRLSERNIELSDSQMDRLKAGWQAAGEKGINESLVMVDQLAFIVNVKNQTVITALTGDEGGQNVFTNIDGAVIA